MLFTPSLPSLPAAPARHRAVRSLQNMKEKLHWVGRRQGCHTCGRRGIRRKYIADHQPPSKFAVETPQRFYPQCAPCKSWLGLILTSCCTAPRIHTATAARRVAILLFFNLSLSLLGGSSRRGALS